MTSVPVCDACWELLAPQAGCLCAVCGENLGIAQFSSSNRMLEDSAARETGMQPGMPERCRPCELAPPAFEQAVAFANYDGVIRRMIHLLKYEGMEPIASVLGKILAPQVAALLRCAAPVREAGILVVPVPLFRGKTSERGFNQATLLAEAVLGRVRSMDPALRLKLAPGLLERRRATASQAGLSTHQRRRNLRGAFFVPEKAEMTIRDQDVLLIDDIYTTGATARACSQALKKAGAGRIWVATAARAQRDGVARWDGAMTPAVQFAFNRIGTAPTAA